MFTLFLCGNLQYVTLEIDKNTKSDVYNMSSHTTWRIWLLCYFNIHKHKRKIEATNLLYIPNLILAIRRLNRCRCYLQKQTQLREKDHSQPLSVVFLHGNLGNLKIALRLCVFVGIEVDDAETIGKPQWDGIGPDFVWINAFWDYVVCQSTATCFLLFKHWPCFSFKLHRNEKKKKRERKPNCHMLKTFTL